jgi:NAD-dependent deacetylase
MTKPFIVIFTGAGVSAESGLATFRASDGLWENHRIEDVASPEGWARNPSLVLDFYNQRRAQAKKAEPNPAHLVIRELEQWFDVQVITQNIDNLHERAGSSRVLHLHGSLFHARGTGQNHQVLEWTEDIRLGDFANDGSQLRPHIVWFGEAVPMIEPAIEQVEKAEAMVVIGTSLQVYPAASLLQYLPPQNPIILLDPNPARTAAGTVEIFAEAASSGMHKVKERLLQVFGILLS